MVREDELIVSKTDRTSRITYVNRAFMRVSGFSEVQLIGKPHRVIRHQDMPRGVFYMLWHALNDGQEFMGYVKNATASGGYYWVLAIVTADKDSAGNTAGYYSVRRKMPDSARKAIEPLYKEMRDVEARHARDQAPQASVEFLREKLAKQNLTYEKFIYQTIQQGRAS